MSMTRNDAIKHFSAQKYTGMTISKAFEAAPDAVRNGLHPQDLTWIQKHQEVDAYEAMQRLYARGSANPTGKTTTREYTAERIDGTIATFDSSAEWYGNNYFPGYKGDAVERFAAEGTAVKLIDKKILDRETGEVEIYEFDDGSRVTIDSNGAIAEFKPQRELKVLEMLVPEFGRMLSPLEIQRLGDLGVFVDAETFIFQHRPSRLDSKVGFLYRKNNRFNPPFQQIYKDVKASVK